MAQRYISLNFGGISVTCRIFPDEKHPRMVAEGAANDRSAYGTFVSYGATYEDPHLWEFTALLTPAEADLLELLHSKHQAAKRVGSSTNPRITLTDTTRRFKEASPRTRATAPAPDNAVTTIDGGLSYFAQFYAYFSRPPEFTQRGNKLAVQLVLEETEEKVAA